LLIRLQRGAVLFNGSEECLPANASIEGVHAAVGMRCEAKGAAAFLERGFCGWLIGIEFGVLRDAHHREYLLKMWREAKGADLLRGLVRFHHHLDHECDAAGVDIVDTAEVEKNRAIFGDSAVRPEDCVSGAAGDITAEAQYADWLAAVSNNLIDSSFCSRFH